MTTGELGERYEQLHGQPCRTRHRAYLIRKIAWRIQANAEGDLSERAERDDLTGLANRRALDDRLREEIDRARRYGAIQDRVARRPENEYRSYLTAQRQRELLL